MCALQLSLKASRRKIARAVQDRGLDFGDLSRLGLLTFRFPGARLSKRLAAEQGC